MKKLASLFILFTSILFFQNQSISAEKPKFLETDWTFKGLFGNLEEASRAGMTARVLLIFKRNS